MSAIKEEQEKATGKTRISVSADEREMLELVRAMKRKKTGLARRRRAVSEAPFDEALIIARGAKSDDLQVERVRLKNGVLVGEKDNFLSRMMAYVSIDTLEEVGGSPADDMGSTDQKRGVLGSILERVASAQASHKRARAAIAKYDETNALTQEVLQRSRELVPDLER